MTMTFNRLLWIVQGRLAALCGSEPASRLMRLRASTVAYGRGNPRVLASV
jgi:hypothetical protein